MARPPNRHVLLPFFSESSVSDCSFPTSFPIDWKDWKYGTEELIILPAERYANFVSLSPSSINSSRHYYTIAARVESMSAIIAEIHLDTSSSSDDKPLPTTPIPLINTSGTALAPSTELHIPLTTQSDTNKPQRLVDLADAMDEARARLNQVLTSWKDWAGKEEVPGTAAKKDGEDEEEQDDEEQEEKE